MNMRKMLLGLAVVLMCASFIYAQHTVNWDFENGNDHGFTLRCQVPATPADDDPDTAGDEALTGVGGDNGLPAAGLAWSIGQPDMFDGLFPAVAEGCHIEGTTPEGSLLYGPCNDPFSACTDGSESPYDFTNGRGQSGYLATYQLNQWGDGLNSAENDQIATSPTVLLEEGAELTVWAYGNTSASWAAPRMAPEFDATEGQGYATGSGGIAVLSAADGSLLSSLFVAAEGGEDGDPVEFTLDLSALAGQEVVIEVVDAFEGGWGWLVIDEIQITNAVDLLAANTINWDFEDGNDHGFTLSCIIPATPSADDPDVAGDESLTGVWGDDGLPGAGLAWTIGQPDQFDFQEPAVNEGCHAESGFLEYGPCNDPFSACPDGAASPYDFTNGRGQSSYLNTYSLNQWGDQLHTAMNDQIATSPTVLLGSNAMLTVWAFGGSTASWAGTKMAPELDPDPAQGYVDGSAGIAVLSADDGSLLTNLFIAVEGGDGNMPAELSLDLSEFADQDVVIEAVDAAAGGWGWLAFDEIQITNATLAEGSDVASRTIAAPTAYALEQNYPNPFNPFTNIQFQIPKNGHVTVTVYNSLGQHIATLVDRNMESGIHNVTFNANHYTSGLYFYRIEADGFSQMKKMMLLK